MMWCFSTTVGYVPWDTMLRRFDPHLVALLIIFEGFNGHLVNARLTGVFTTIRLRWLFTISQGGRIPNHSCLFPLCLNVDFISAYPLKNKYLEDA